MERLFHKLDESHDIMELISSSPQEAQQEDRVYDDSANWPTGMYLDVVKVVRNGRIRRYFGMAKIGERLTIPGEQAQPKKPAPVQRAMELSKGVKEASDENLEVMAARNSVRVDDRWRKQPRTKRMADVQEAMNKPQPVGAT